MLRTPYSARSPGPLYTHRQLTGAPLDLGGLNDRAILAALREAAAGQRVLLVIDDAWASAQVHSFACLDASTDSAAVVTTRIHASATTVHVGTSM